MSDRKALLAALAWALPEVPWKIDVDGFVCRYCESNRVGNSSHRIKHAADCPYVRACDTLQKTPE